MVRSGAGETKCAVMAAAAAAAHLLLNIMPACFVEIRAEAHASVRLCVVAVGLGHLPALSGADPGRRSGPPPRCCRENPRCRRNVHQRLGRFGVQRRREPTGAVHVRLVLVCDAAAVKHILGLLDVLVLLQYAVGAHGVQHRVAQRVQPLAKGLGQRGAEPRAQSHALALARRLGGPATKHSAVPVQPCGLRSRRIIAPAATATLRAPAWKRLRCAVGGQAAERRQGGLRRSSSSRRIGRIVSRGLIPLLDGLVDEGGGAARG